MQLVDVRGKVDFGIITIREDEFEAVLARFPAAGRVTGRRQYNLRRVTLPGGGSYLVSVVRCIEQGNGEAQSAAHDLLEDLNPRWLLVVGIAGGIPSDAFTLGDVVVSTRIHDFSVEAVLHESKPEYALAGGPVEKAAAALAANLPALKEELGPWNAPTAIATERPSIELNELSLYGDDHWKDTVRKSLLRHTGRAHPIVSAGAIASSDRLIKDTEILAVWMKVARHVLAVEMESAGVYRATYGRQVPTLSIRGISDIVGFKRNPAWTQYACHSAAAFALALMQTRPFEPSSPSEPEAHGAPREQPRAHMESPPAPDVNPYNCSSPGNLFVGYEELRKSMLRGLRNGKSYALLGGRRCGKTSMLLKLQEDLQGDGLAPFRVLPRFIDIQELVPRSSFDVFSRIYALTVEGLSVEPWSTPPPRQHYQEFLARLDKAQSWLEQAYGPKWLVVLLIDELDTAPEHLPDDECFQNLRNLLTASAYRSHFRVVASGCSGMGSLISSSSPLNNLDPEYTRILTPAETRSLLAAGFSQGMDAPVEAEFLTRTGRHPYALQGLLGILWEERRPITEELVRRAARRFARDRVETFKTWQRDLREEGRACYGALAHAPEGRLHEREIRSRIAKGLSVSEGLRTLSYHGLIDEEDPDQPRITGTIFKDWFLDHSQLGLHR